MNTKVIWKIAIKSAINSYLDYTYRQTEEQPNENTTNPVE